MNIKLSLVLLSSLLPVACGQVSSADKLAASAPNGAEVSSGDQAANQLYLNDVVDSAAEESSTTSTTEVDSSVEADVKAERLAQMVTKLIAELDADASGSLSLDEFLAGPAKRAEDTHIDADKLAKITEKMTEDFNKYAGTDVLLSADELKILLSEVAPRVGRHRHDNFPGQHAERVKLAWADVIAKYDTDADGKLNQAEFEAMEADRTAEFKKIREERSRHGVHARGPGESFGDHHGSAPAEGSESEGE